MQVFQWFDRYNRPLSLNFTIINNENENELFNLDQLVDFQKDRNSYIRIQKGNQVKTFGY